MRSDPRTGGRSHGCSNFELELPKIQAMRGESDEITSPVAAPNYMGSPCLPARSAAGALERVPIKRNRSIAKDSLEIEEFEHIGIDKVEPLFRDTL